MFRKCFGGHRFFYNKAVAEINERYKCRKAEFDASATCVHCTQPKIDGTWTCAKHKDKALPWKLQVSLPSIRAKVMKTDKELAEEEFWQKEIPFDTRQLAIKDAISAYKACVTNKARGNIDQFTLRFTSRKKPSSIFWINDTALRIRDQHVHLFPKRLKSDSVLRMRKRIRTRLPTNIDADAKVLYDRGAYYLVLTISEDVKKLEQNCQDAIALDPGVRTFMTGYSPNGHVCKIGEHHVDQIKKLHQRIDLLRSVRSKATKRRTRWRLRQRLAKLEFALYCNSQELHNQSASILSQTYGTILLPTFGTSKMQAGDVLGSTTKRRMQGLCHYQFQQKLIGLCEKHQSKLYLVDESYTTKTCGACGKMNPSVGSAHVFTCQCGYTLDRDIHGARNIWIKTMTEHGVLTHTPQTIAR